MLIICSHCLNLQRLNGLRVIILSVVPHAFLHSQFDLAAVRLEAWIVGVNQGKADRSRALDLLTQAALLHGLRNSCLCNFKVDQFDHCEVDKGNNCGIEDERAEVTDAGVVLLLAIRKA